MRLKEKGYPDNTASFQSANRVENLSREGGIFQDFKGEGEKKNIE
jgi:hypothetical protein